MAWAAWAQSDAGAKIKRDQTRFLSRQIVRAKDQKEIETKLQVQRYLSMGSLGEARKAAVLGLTTTMILVLCVGWLGLVSANVKITLTNPRDVGVLRHV